MLATVSRYVIIYDVFSSVILEISSSETDANYCRIILQFFFGGAGGGKIMKKSSFCLKKINNATFLSEVVIIGN